MVYCLCKLEGLIVLCARIKECNMADVIESYKLGKIEVSISETDRDNKLQVVCNDGNYRSEFTIRKYEYENYKRHMNQRIKNAYKQQYSSEE